MFPTRDSATDLDIVYTFLKDAEKYGLTTEVVLYALYYMRENPNSLVDEAMVYGYDEWVK